MMKKLFYLLSLVAVLFITGCTEDKTNFLYGDVVDKATEAPLEGCRVLLRDAQGKLLSEQQTGADGRWGFEVELGTYSLAFMKEGYEPLEESDIEIEYDHTLVQAIAYLGTTDSEIKIEWTEIEEEPDVANGFAGGDGSKGNPYLIKNSRQLRLISEYGSGDVFFKLINDIDLNYKNWRPLESFSGVLDGNGHTISNLRVEYNEDECEYRGLIGKLDGGSISNLTVRGVKIYGGCSGTFAGYMRGGQITNCHVTLENDSELKSGNYIGGIAGHSYYGAKSYIINCSVKSAVQDDKYRINGKSYVGGIAGGHEYLTIESCQVACNIIGEQYVGGIVGQIYAYNSGNTKNCLYQGNISGSNYVGGICGYLNANTTNIAIVGCKVVADIECDGDQVGGISGYGDVIACYAEGTITCENYSADDVYGISSGSVNLSYSTMLCTHSAYYPIGSKNTYSYSIYDNIDNIAEKIQESYSEYCDYWDFNNYWTWSGTIKGKSKQVICPRLAWEQ